MSEDAKIFSIGTLHTALFIYLCHSCLVSAQQHLGVVCVLQALVWRVPWLFYSSICVSGTSWFTTKALTTQCVLFLLYLFWIVLWMHSSKKQKTDFGWNVPLTDMLLLRHRVTHILSLFSHIQINDLTNTTGHCFLIHRDKKLLKIEVRVGTQSC